MKSCLSVFDTDCVFCPRLTLILSCPMDLKNFPMDVQTCTMQLESCKDFVSSFNSHCLIIHIWLKRPSHVPSWLHHERLDLRVAGGRGGAGVRGSHAASVHHEGGEGAGLLYQTLQHWWEDAVKSTSVSLTESPPHVVAACVFLQQENLPASKWSSTWSDRWATI